MKRTKQKTQQHPRLALQREMIALLTPLQLAQVPAGGGASVSCRPTGNGI